MSKEIIRFTLNGKQVEVNTDPQNTLLWVLRTDLGAMGTKFGCGLGFCGSCTILLNGEPLRSCMLSASDARGKKITTIEGLSVNGKLHPLQQAFMDHDALQCGYCTPGMILTAFGLLAKNPGSHGKGDHRWHGGKPLPLRGSQTDRRSGQVGRQSHEKQSSCFIGEGIDPPLQKSGGIRAMLKRPYISR